MALTKKDLEAIEATLQPKFDQINKRIDAAYDVLEQVVTDLGRYRDETASMLRLYERVEKRVSVLEENR